MTGTVFRLGDQALRAARMPGLDSGHLHEIHAKADDRAAALAFALARGGAGKAMLVRLARRGRTVPSGEGLMLLGIDPARLVLVEADDERDLLRAGLEAARCPGVGLVLLETRGRCPGYDLTASRRLALAVRRSRACAVVLRHEAEPRPSVAQTRWAVASAASRPLEAGAPGWPALEAELLRWRGGPAGWRWRLEWDSIQGGFRNAADPAPLLGAVVSLARLRAAAANREPGRPRAA